MYSSKNYVFLQSHIIHKVWKNYFYLMLTHLYTEHIMP